MPFTPNRDWKHDPKMIVRAEGMYCWSDRGAKIIDASSGLFCCAAGHGRQEIADAVVRQLRELDFCAPFLRGHPKQFELATRLSELTPGDLNRIFFVNSGSEAIDTAMKVALAYHQARGQLPAARCSCRANAPTTASISAASRCPGSSTTAAASDPPFRASPTCATRTLPENRFTQGEGAHGAELAEDLQRFVTLYGAENIAACFVEPIAGSTGVLVPPKGYLKRLREICDQHGILLVFDEVITGFGRTGQAFAAQSFGVTPDIMTMAKALTNAAQPMGAVAVSERVHDAIFAAAPEDAIEFFHGYTYSGHPAACAAGLATLDIYRDEALFERGRALSPYFLDAIFSLKDIPVVADIRGYGMLAAIELHSDGVAGRRGHAFQKKLFDDGLNLKTTGDAAIIAPPLIAERAHVDTIVEILRSTLVAI